MSPDTSPAKRTRGKPKVVAKEPVVAKPATPKKLRAPRKSPTEPAQRPVVASASEPIQEDVGSMIATAAYYLAAARNFTPGHELDDWLQAERLVHAKVYG